LMMSQSLNGLVGLHRHNWRGSVGIFPHFPCHVMHHNMLPW
jgi:hypothetical protein